MAHRLSKTQERALSKLKKFGKWLTPWELHERITTLEALHDRGLVERKYGENWGLYPKTDTFYKHYKHMEEGIVDIEKAKSDIKAFIAQAELIAQNTYTQGARKGIPPDDNVAAKWWAGRADGADWALSLLDGRQEANMLRRVK